MFDTHSVEQKLIEARAGSDEAIWDLLALCRGYLMCVAQKRFDQSLQAKFDPSDLVEETMLHAKCMFPQFHGKSGKQWLGWIRQILLSRIAMSRREFHQQKRDVKREVSIDPDSTEFRSLGNAILDKSDLSANRTRNESEQRVALFLLRIPEAYRQVLKLRYEIGLTFECIGRIMNRSADSVRRLCAKAEKMLANYSLIRQ